MNSEDFILFDSLCSWDMLNEGRRISNHSCFYVSLLQELRTEFSSRRGRSRNCPLCDSTLWVTEEPLTEVVTEENHRWIPNVLIDSPDKMPEPNDDETQDSENTNLAPSPAKITANPH